MENPGSGSDLSKALTEVSAALFELRNALVEMSLSLRDWQFETDLDQRRIAEHAVRKLLEQIASARDPSS